MKVASSRGLCADIPMQCSDSRSILQEMCWVATLALIVDQPLISAPAASCSADLSIKLWDFTSYDNLKTLNGHEHNVSGVCFIPPGDYLASCSRDTTIKIWETSTG